MKCPACGHGMTEVNVQDVKVDVCQGGCGGIWFDGRELRKVDEPHESLGEDLMHVVRDASVTIVDNDKRTCPRCKDMPMMQHFASVRREVTVDECPNCAGYFLDYGELNQIRVQYETEEERSKAAESLFADLFDDSIAAAAMQSEAKLERAKRLARMFRFLLPSHYIPGKQKWGAF